MAKAVGIFVDENSLYYLDDSITIPLNYLSHQI